MNWSELKTACENSDRLKLLTEKQFKQYEKEIYRAKITYDNHINLYEEFHKKKEKLKNKYVIPYLLNFTDEILDGEIELTQVKTGASGGKHFCLPM